MPPGQARVWGALYWSVFVQVFKAELLKDHSVPIKLLLHLARALYTSRLYHDALDVAAHVQKKVLGQGLRGGGAAAGPRWCSGRGPPPVH